MLERVVDVGYAADKKNRSWNYWEREIMNIRRIFIYVRGDIKSPFTEKSRFKDKKYKAKSDLSKGKGESLGYKWATIEEADEIEPLPFYEMEITCKGSEMWNILVSQRESAQVVWEPAANMDKF